MMQAINQAAGILHKNIKNAVRRYHGPHSPIKSEMEFGMFVAFPVCRSPFTVEHMILTRVYHVTNSDSLPRTDRFSQSLSTILKI